MPTIAERAAAVLAEQGPLTVDALAAALVAEGKVTARDPVMSVRNALRYNSRVVERAGRYRAVSDLLEHVVLTHRLTCHERMTGTLPYDEDLSLLMDVAHGARVNAGTLRAKHGQRITGPHGWLHEFTVDELLGFRLRRGFLQISPVLLAADADARERHVLDHLRPRLEDHPPGWRAPTLRNHLIEMLADEPDLLSEAISPLREVLLRDTLIAPPATASHVAESYGRHLRVIVPGHVLVDIREEAQRFGRYPEEIAAERLGSWQDDEGFVDPFPLGLRLVPPDELDDVEPYWSG